MFPHCRTFVFTSSWPSNRSYGPTRVCPSGPMKVTDPFAAHDRYGDRWHTYRADFRRTVDARSEIT